MTDHIRPTGFSKIKILAAHVLRYEDASRRKRRERAVQDLGLGGPQGAIRKYVAPVDVLVVVVLLRQLLGRRGHGGRRAVPHIIENILEQADYRPFYELTMPYDSLSMCYTFRLPHGPREQFRPVNMVVLHYLEGNLCDAEGGRQPASHYFKRPEGNFVHLGRCNFSFPSAIPLLNLHPDFVQSPGDGLCAVSVDLSQALGWRSTDYPMFELYGLELRIKRNVERIRPVGAVARLIFARLSVNADYLTFKDPAAAALQQRSFRLLLDAHAKRGDQP